MFLFVSRALNMLPHRMVTSVSVEMRTIMIDMDLLNVQLSAPIMMGRKSVVVAGLIEYGK